MSPAFKDATGRIFRSIAVCPNNSGWRYCLVAFVIYVALALPLGLATGALRFESSNDTFGRLLTFSLVAVFVPCLSEELFFRALLLPDPRLPSSTNYKIARATIALLLFVLWHPINGLFLKTAARQTFLDPGFLMLTALLGSCCTTMYLRTASIWPSTLVHWVTVVCWKAFLGGRIFESH
jgi:predicted Abi (CAAX) family protease